MRSVGVAILGGSGASEPVRVRVPMPDIVLPRLLRRPARFLSRIDFELPPRFGLKATAAFLVAIGLYGVVLGGHVETMVGGATAAAGLKINGIRISGQSETAELEVLQRLAIPEHGSLLTLDIDAARERVEQIPWVAEATLRKVYPDTLQVEIVERVPFALWQRDGNLALIDVEGTVLSDYVAPRYRHLPVLVGAGAQSEAAEIVALIGEFPTLHPRVRAATLVSGRRWNLTLDNDIVVMLPETDPVPALIQLEALDQSQQLLSRDIISVDLRLADRVVVGLDEVIHADVVEAVADRREEAVR